MQDVVEKRYERIEGEEILMSPSSTPHLRIQGNFHAILWNFLKGRRCEVFSEHKVLFEEKNWLQPDILVVCDPAKIKLNHIEGAPDFVAEILSPSTEKRDVGIKKDIYEKFGVREYWIIHPKAESVTVYLLKDRKYLLDNVYHLLSEEELECLSEEERAEQEVPLKLSLYDDLEIRLEDLFAKPMYNR